MPWSDFFQDFVKYCISGYQRNNWAPRSWTLFYLKPTKHFLATNHILRHIRRALYITCPLQVFTLTDKGISCRGYFLLVQKIENVKSKKTGFMKNLKCAFFRRSFERINIPHRHTAQLSADLTTFLLYQQFCILLLVPWPGGLFSTLLWIVLWNDIVTPFGYQIDYNISRRSAARNETCCRKFVNNR